MSEIMTKAKIKKALTQEGVKCAYSGHSKTFFVDKYPSGTLLANIQQGSGLTVLLSNKPNY